MAFGTGLGLGSYQGSKLPSGLANGLILQNMIFVAKNGNDSTGKRNRLDLPFLTIAGAETVALAGDTIVICPGTYDENGLGVTDVSYYFENGAHIEYTGADASYIFEFSSGFSKIDGNGEFTVTAASNGAGILQTSGIGTQVSFEGFRCSCEATAKYIARNTSISAIFFNCDVTRGGTIASEGTNPNVGLFASIKYCQSKITTANVGTLSIEISNSHVTGSAGVYAVDYGCFFNCSGQVYYVANNSVTTRNNPTTDDGFYHFEGSGKYFVTIETRCASATPGNNAPLFSSRNEANNMQINISAGFLLNQNTGASAWIGKFAQTNPILIANFMHVKLKGVDARAQGGGVVNTFVTNGVNQCDIKHEPSFLNLALSGNYNNVVGAPTVNVNV